MGGVLIVCRADRTRHRALRHTIKHFRATRAHVLGGVINDVGLGRGLSFADYAYYHRDYYTPKG